MRKSTVFLFLFFTLPFSAFAQYWQQTVNYLIDVSLNDKEHTLDGFEKLTYINNSPDTLHFIWFHIWPNAYKTDRTAYSEQQLENGNTRFYFSSKEQRGYINRLDFKVGGITAKTEDHPEHIDILKVHLPAPLAPGQQAVITTPFHVKLPYNFSRSGYDKGAYHITQWYPKPAVYDRKGWHPMPYLDQGEFYSEFGSYDVRITLPKDYVVAATGALQNDEEKAWLKNRKEQADSNKGKIKSSVAGKPKPAAMTKKKVPAKAVTAVETKTLRYVQDSVHDFALFANKRFVVDYDTCQLPSGKLVNVSTYYTPDQQQLWSKTLQFTKDALRSRSAWIGDYPYGTVSVVQGAGDFGGGMEYPTITAVSPLQDEKLLDEIIAHEVGHNWFYGALASNERQHPWLDEGLNSYYDNRYHQWKYGNTGSNSGNPTVNIQSLQRLLFQTVAHTKKDQPIETHAAAFTDINYDLVAYYKAAKWLEQLEQQIGTAALDKAMQAYYQQWQFKHPYPQDLQQVLEQQTGSDLSAFFNQLFQKGLLPADSTKPVQSWMIASPLQPKSLLNYINKGAKNLLLVSPAAGYNKYDGFMLGGLVTNYKLPPNKFQFLAAPLYATASKKLNGLTQLGYTVYPNNAFSKIEASVFAAHFSKNMHRDSNNKKVFERFYKVSPSLRFTLAETPRSTRERWLEVRSYFIGETEFKNFVQKSTDSLIYVDSTEKATRYINQLTIGTANYRALYPYNVQLQLQQGERFYRINFTGNYFFNYAKGGGANVRLFAAKFGYLSNNDADRFSTTLYHPKLLGVTGEEDYTYSNYFLGRTASYANDASVIKNSGLAAQQIMIRDGGLKLRLDQYEFLQGRSDDWVAAVNFTTTLPEKLFPIKLPLKLFFDAGTFAQAWEKGETISRFLYVGGLQLSLFRNVVNIYAPILYSNEFRDNLKTLPEQNTFFKRLTFSIDFNQLSPRNLTGNKFSF